MPGGAGGLELWGKRQILADVSAGVGEQPRSAEGRGCGLGKDEGVPADFRGDLRNRGQSGPPGETTRS